MNPRFGAGPAGPLIAFWIAALLSSAAAAQAGRYDAALATTQAAQTLQAGGQWPQARAQLERQGGDCGSEPDGRACRLLVRFSLGLLAEREAASRNPADPALLEQAAGYYRAVLAEAPDHEATLKNLALVYRALQRPDEAEQALKQAALQDRSGSGRAAMMLGQLYRDTGRPDAALDAYEEVGAGGGPSADAALRATVLVYRELPPERAEELLRRCIAWEATEPAVAAAGYRAVIERALPSRPAVAEQAVLRWAPLLARNGWLSASALAGPWGDWAPLSDLQRFVSSADPRPDDPRWWLLDSRRRSALAEVALALATSPQVQADPGRAARRLEQALQFCPRYDEYAYGELRNERMVRLDLSRELIALYSRNPALDPAQSRQRALINELFSGKGGAYESSDLAAIQRFHGTLGQIYAQRGTWAGEGATNARFQFENMLRTAERRERQGGYVQPLQDVKAQLAQGYETLQRTGQARAMHLRAAQAYLDTDQIDAALASLQSARRLAQPTSGAAEQRSIELVQRIAGTRQAIAEGVAVEPGAGGAHGWLNEPAGAVGGDAAGAASFVARQQFKALADLALRQRDGGSDASAEAAAARAFAAALRVAAMVGTADLIRLERVKEQATAHAAYPRRRTDVDATAPTRDFAGKSWVLYVPAEPAALYVKVGSDAVLAGRLAAAWRADPALARQALKFSIDGGRVAVTYPPGSAAPMAASVDRLRSVEGVRAWTVAPARE